MTYQNLQNQPALLAQSPDAVTATGTAAYLVQCGNELAYAIRNDDEHQITDRLSEINNSVATLVSYVDARYGDYPLRWNRMQSLQRASGSSSWIPFAVGFALCYLLTFTGVFQHFQAYLALLLQPR